jgi:hypothetical protein
VRKAWSFRPSSAALVAASAAVAAFVLVNRGAPWRGSWAWTVDYALGTTVLTGPLTAAAATYRAAAERRRVRLYESTRRGWLVPARAAAWAATCNGVAYGLILVVALLFTWSVPHGGSVPWAVAIVGPLLLCWYAALGAFTGRLVPHLITAPVTAVLAFGVGLMGAVGIGPNVIRHGPVTGSLTGLTWDRTVLLGQIGVIAGLSVVLTVAAVGSVRSRPRWVAMLGVLGVVSCTLGYASLLRSGDERFVPSDETASACAGARPVVCVAPSDRIVLKSLAAQVDRAAAALYEVGAAVPGRFDELMPSGNPSPEHGFFPLMASASDPETSLGEAAGALTTPRACPQWSAPMPPSWHVFAVQNVLRGWLIRRAGNTQLDSLGLNRRAEAWLAASSPEQDAWVRSTYATLRTCQFDQLELPWNRR